MAQTESNEDTPRPYDVKFSWRAAIFAVLLAGRYFGVADAKGVIEQCLSQEGDGRICGLRIFGTICALSLTCFVGYIVGSIAGRITYNVRFNWRAAAFAVLLYGKYFAGTDEKNIIDQCMSQEGDDGKCGVQLINILLALYSTCSAGYLFTFLVAPFGRDQSVKLSWNVTIFVTIFAMLSYVLYSGVVDDVVAVVIQCISREGEGGECGGQIIRTVSTLLLTYFVPLIVGDLPRYPTFLYHQILRLLANVVSRILSIISRILSVTASGLEAMATNLRAASRNANENPDESITSHQMDSRDYLA
ncbi:hypothetical protein N7510_004751 [Penicillium lagena]|uniref:uncharacterized protein n=1 Tax=Penicillium lagena TaxID=94218 RepID=UPI002541F5B2|nr:uncharacterized protein N7510_004751 [Penicillium lagena]KAJ5620767.1 hypothetical protein N7510_004751 [Penicillium lagena]